MVRTEANATVSEKKVALTVIEECGVIGTRKKGKETLRLDYGAWNGNTPKYEIRVWSAEEDGTLAARKGIGLTGEELIALGELIQKLQQDEEPAQKKPAKRSRKSA